ncbi:MAG: NAD(+) synthase [Chitinispirillales bacterium]|jgi:NAD+ synthase|nr:NAD(+) synthase [Chitinispirillales bacterium]
MFNAIKVKNDIIQWIRNYFDENGKNCNAVIGISGGKDSTVAAALCVEAISYDRVVGILMPYGEQHDIDTAQEVIDTLGIKHYLVNIKQCVDTLAESINTVELTLSKQAIINTPARIRMTTLYAVAATIDGRVVNTCNLSEDWVGYATKYGDNAGDFSPLARLTVTEIKAIGNALGLPSKFVDKIPEDGLTGLTDEENLGISYDVLDKYIREGICDDPTMKNKIDTLHKQGLHKLKPMPCFEF